jgi:hypothetical protein
VRLKSSGRLWVGTITVNKSYLLVGQVSEEVAINTIAACAHSVGISGTFDINLIQFRDEAMVYLVIMSYPAWVDRNTCWTKTLLFFVSVNHRQN